MRNRSKFKRSKLYLLSAAVAATSMTVPVAAMQLGSGCHRTEASRVRTTWVLPLIRLPVSKSGVGHSQRRRYCHVHPGLTVNETAATGCRCTPSAVSSQDYSTAASSTVGIYFDEGGYALRCNDEGLAV